MHTRVLADTTEISRQDWLTLRRSGLGASDAAAILDLDPWRSPWICYLEKVGELPERESSEAMEIGSRIEGFIAELFAERTGLRVWHPQAIYRHPKHDWMLCTPDRFIVDPAGRSGDGLLEIKNASAWKADEWREDQAPAHYIVQVQWALAVTGCAWGHLAALVGGNRLVHRPITRDDELIGMLTAAGTEFWQRIRDRNPPPIDGSDSTEAAIKALFAESEPDSCIPLSEAAAADIEIYHDAHRRAREAEAEKRAAANRIRHALGEAEAGVLPGEDSPCVTWRPQTRTDFDLEQFKADHPDLHAKYRRTKVIRVLRPKKRST